LRFWIFLLLSCHVAFDVKGCLESFLSNQQLRREKSYHHELNKQVAFQAGSMLIRWDNCLANEFESQFCAISIFLLLSSHVAFDVKGWLESFLSNQQLCGKKSYHHELNKQVAFQAGSMLIRWDNCLANEFESHFCAFQFSYFCRVMLLSMWKDGYNLSCLTSSFVERKVITMNWTNKLPFKLEAC
jgi:hypothetical protein